MTRPQDRKHERNAIIALFAVFALLAQALIPAAALAGPRLVAGDLICDGGRVHTASAPLGPTGKKAMGGMPCQDCLAAALAAVAPPPAPAVQLVTYAAERVEHSPDAPAPTPRARGPPRPFGQGPPTA